MTVAKDVVTAEEIRQAQRALQGIIKQTPLQSSRTFSEMSQNQVLLKPESLQKVGSFKLRGAYNVVRNLPREALARGLVSCSAGNWAQGLAYAAKMAGARATIVLPEKPSMSKMQAVKGYGADVVLYGKNSVEMFEKMHQIHAEKGYTEINAFDNPPMIAGHGTLGLEILEEAPDTEVIVVPIGGGSLISGIAVAAKSLNSKVKIIGVQPAGANAMYLSWKTGKLQEIDRVQTVADGLAVKKPGELTLALVKEYVDDIVVVEDDEIIRALLLCLERAKLLIEPAAAASLAAILSGKTGITGAKMVAVLSGGNIDASLLREFLGREERK